MEASAGVGPFVGQPSSAAPTAPSRTRPLSKSRVGDWPDTNRLLPWALFGFVAMLWVIPFDSIILPIGTPVDASLDRVFLVAIAVIWLISDGTLRRDRSVLRSPVHWSFAIFTLIALLSVLRHEETLVRIGGPRPGDKTAGAARLLRNVLRPGRLDPAAR